MNEEGRSGRLTRKRFTTGGSFETNYGFSRAIQVDDRVFISGTTAQEPGNTGKPGEAAQQTRRILEAAGQILQRFGGSIDDVVMYRCFVVDMTAADEVARVLGEVFARSRPAGTLVGTSALFFPSMLVEMDFEAILGSGEAFEDI